MDFIKKLKISQKLQVLIAISLLFVAVVGVLGFFYTNKASAGMKSIYEENLIIISELGEIRGNFEQGIADVLYLFDDLSAEQKKHWKDDLIGLRKQNGELLKKYSEGNITDYEKERISKIMDVAKVFWGHMYTAIDYATSNKGDVASKIFKDNLHYIVEDRTLIGELITFNKEEAEKIYNQNKNDSKLASIIIIITILASIGFLVTLGLMLSNMITKPIYNAIDQLSTGSDEVSAASSQVESASQQMAEGSAEQAASIQETSSTLEETSSMVQQNNENTRQAAVLARNAKQFADKGSGEMGNMMNAMEELQKSSHDIAKIIKVIDEIAFQTNLLSLNAAVEAARAGDAGKGFAVVAEEVRNLAQRSAQAAKDTTAIIESNISLSENSVGMAKDVNNSLIQIDEEAKKVSELLGEISTATEEQSKGISEINKAVSQMEEVISSNAQTAEECASASRELSAQAESVKDIVASLAEMVNGEGSGHHTGSARQIGAGRYSSANKLPSSQGSPKYLGHSSSDF